MHDLLAAKDIFDLIRRYARRHRLKNVKTVEIELGSFIHQDHAEDISAANLKANLKMLAKNSLAEKADFQVKKIKGQGYRLVTIEGDQ